MQNAKNTNSRYQANGKLDELENRNKSMQKQLQSAQAELRHASGLRFELEDERNRSEQLKLTFEGENTTLRKEIADLRAKYNYFCSHVERLFPSVLSFSKFRLTCQHGFDCQQSIFCFRVRLKNVEEPAKTLDFHAMPQLGVSQIEIGDKPRQPKFKSAGAEMEWQDVEKLQNDFRQEHDELTRMKSELAKFCKFKISIK